MPAARQPRLSRVTLPSRRSAGAGSAFPKVVAIISLGASADPVSLREALVNLADGPVDRSSLGRDGADGCPVTAVQRKLRQRFTYLVAPREIVGILDAAKAADLLLFLLPMHRGTGPPAAPLGPRMALTAAPRALGPGQTSAWTTPATLP